MIFTALGFTGGQDGFHFFPSILMGRDRKVENKHDHFYAMFIK